MQRPSTPRRAAGVPAHVPRPVASSGIAAPIIPSVFLEADRLADRGRSDGAALQASVKAPIGAAIYHHPQHFHAAAPIAVDPQYPLVDMAMRNLRSRAPSPSAARRSNLAATPARGFAALASKTSTSLAAAAPIDTLAADAHGWTRHQHAGRDVRSALPHFGGVAAAHAEIVFAVDDLLRAQRRPEPVGPTMEQLEALTLELRDARAAAATAMEMAQHTEQQLRAEAARRERDAAAEAQRHAERMQFELREAERRAREAEEQRQRLALDLERQRVEEQRRLDEAARSIERAVMARLEFAAACQRLELAEADARRDGQRQEDEDRRRLLGAAAIVPAAIEAEAATRIAAAAHQAASVAAAAAGADTAAPADVEPALERARAIAADAEASAAREHLRDVIADSVLHDSDPDGGEALRLMHHLRTNVLRSRAVSPPACPSIVSQVASCGSSRAALEDLAERTPPGAFLVDDDHDASLRAMIMSDPMSVGRDARVQLLLRRSADMGRMSHVHDPLGARHAPHGFESPTKGPLQHHTPTPQHHWAPQPRESIDVSGLHQRPWSPPRPVATFAADSGSNVSPARTVAYTASALVQSPLVAITGRHSV